MSLSMRYGCKVRNRAAIIFWEDKHMRKNLLSVVSLVFQDRQLLSAWNNWAI